MPDESHTERPRACASCAKAKAKCVWPGGDDGVCQRCTKNSLTCSRLHSVSKKRRGKAIQSRHIERRLDDIMAILNQDKRPQPSQSDYTGGPFLSQYPVSHGSPFPPLSSAAGNVPGTRTSFSDADQILEEYTSTMLAQFPFVPLPKHSAHGLYQLKPLLLHTILWVCRPGGPDAYATFEIWFRQHISHQTVVSMKKNLEIVQAILVFLAWRDIYFYATASDTALLQIAIGLIGDLGLNGARRSANPSFRSVVEDATQLRDGVLHQPAQTRDGHRAALGVYYISSTLCSILGKRSRLEYTAHFDDCCRQLQDEQEYPTDLLLVSLVRIQKIAIKVNDAFHETPELSNSRPHTIHSLAVGSIRNELDGFVRQLPDHLKSNHLLQTHCAAVQIRLFEPLKLNSGRDSSVPSNLRYQNIWECLESCRTLHSTFCQIPTSSLPHLTFVPFLHLSLALIKSMTILCLEDPTWDAATALSMYDFPHMLQQVIKLFDGASGSGSPRTQILLHGKPMFSEYAEAYRRIERWYSTKINSGVAEEISNLVDTGVSLGGEQFEGFDFWNQLSDLTYGLVP